MQLKVLAFAQAREQLGWSEQVVECDATETPRELVQRLAATAELSTARPAVDYEYCDWDAPIGEARELAIIPPVSGG